MKNAVQAAGEILKAEADAILNLMNHLDEDFQRAIDLIMEQQGRVLVLGVGKSGHIGKKIAATLASTGQPAFFIHPTEAIHGDLGMMVEGDICLLISHSGSTSELLETIPAIKRIGLPVISVTSNPDSKLAKYCLLRLRGFNEEQFAICHPGGVLGKRLLTRVSDIMITENLPISHEKDSFRMVLATMTKGRQGVTMVVDDASRCIGILTDGDLRRTFERYDIVSEIRLGDVYTRNPKTISPEALAVEALKKMEDNRITSLIVVNDDRRIIGLIHIHHLLEKGFY